MVLLDLLDELVLLLQRRALRLGLGRLLRHGSNQAGWRRRRLGGGSRAVRRDEGRRRRRWSAAACKARYRRCTRRLRRLGRAGVSRGASSRPRGAECCAADLAESRQKCRPTRRAPGGKKIDRRSIDALVSQKSVSSRVSVKKTVGRFVLSGVLPRLPSLSSGVKTSRSTTARVVGVVERAAARRTVEALGNHVLRREGASRSSARTPSVSDAHPNPARCRSVARRPTFQTVDVDRREIRGPSPLPLRRRPRRLLPFSSPSAGYAERRERQDGVRTLQGRRGAAGSRGAPPCCSARARTTRTDPGSNLSGYKQWFRPGAPIFPPVCAQGGRHHLRSVSEGADILVLGAPREKFSVAEFDALKAAAIHDGPARWSSPTRAESRKPWAPTSTISSRNTASVSVNDSLVRTVHQKYRTARETVVTAGGSTEPSAAAQLAERRSGAGTGSGSARRTGTPRTRISMTAWPRRSLCRGRGGGRDDVRDAVRRDAQVVVCSGGVLELRRTVGADAAAPAALWRGNKARGEGDGRVFVLGSGQMADDKWLDARGLAVAQTSHRTSRCDGSRANLGGLKLYDLDARSGRQRIRAPSGHGGRSFAESTARAHERDGSVGSKDFTALFDDRVPDGHESGAGGGGAVRQVGREEGAAESSRRSRETPLLLRLQRRGRRGGGGERPSAGTRSLRGRGGGVRQRTESFSESLRARRAAWSADDVRPASRGLQNMWMPTEDGKMDGDHPTAAARAGVQEGGGVQDRRDFQSEALGNSQRSGGSCATTWIASRARCGG